MREAQTATNLDHARSLAHAFINALMGAEIKKLEGCPDIGYLEHIPLLRTGNKKTIVLTKEVEQFWMACFHWSRTYRVCAVGSPGAGKSTTMMYLIRILLEHGKKVVYLHRTQAKGSYYYVWTKNEDGNYTTAIHPEASPTHHIINWDNGDDVGDTYYLCDPGDTLTSCNPSPSLAASVVINASGDDHRHWGDRNFTKKKEVPSEQYGKMLFFPLPKLQQLRDACHLFSKSATKEQVDKRHRMFGCIPRHVFADESEVEDLLETQEDDIAMMTADMTRRIVDNTAVLDNNNRNCPRSSVMGMTSDPSDFTEPKAIYISDLVTEQVARRHMKDLWNEVSAAENSSTRGLLFESYTNGRTTKCSNAQRMWKVK